VGGKGNAPAAPSTPGAPAPVGGAPAAPGGKANYASDKGVSADTIRIGTINMTSATRSLGPAIAGVQEQSLDAAAGFSDPAPELPAAPKLPAAPAAEAAVAPSDRRAASFEEPPEQPAPSRANVSPSPTNIRPLLVPIARSMVRPPLGRQFLDTLSTK